MLIKRQNSVRSRLLRWSVASSELLKRFFIQFENVDRGLVMVDFVLDSVLDVLVVLIEVVVDVLASLPCLFHPTILLNVLYVQGDVDRV
jgi:hypothetical protein